MTQNTSTRTSRFRLFFESLLEGVLSTLMTALCVLVIGAVLFRKMGSSLAWYDEIASVLLAWLTFYGASLAVLKGAHIGFPGLVRRLPQSSRVVFLVVREIVVTGFFAGFAWAGWKVLLVMQGASLVSIPWIPYRLTHSVLLVGAIFFLIAEILQWPSMYEAALSFEEDEQK